MNPIVLPENYHWIPGFEGRYALYLGKVKNSLSPDSDVIYSFIASGFYGRPYAMTAKSGNKFYLTKRPGSYYKTQITLSEATRLLKTYKPGLFKTTPAQAFTELCKTMPADSYTFLSAQWIIGSVKNNIFSFSNEPKAHTTQASAYAEVERLAKCNPGVEYVVFKTVRKARAAVCEVIDFS